MNPALYSIWRKTEAFWFTANNPATGRSSASSSLRRSAAPWEADLVDGLYGEDAVLASFVADYAGRPVGHVLFSRMHIDECERVIPAVALAPMAVEPTFQRQASAAR